MFVRAIFAFIFLLHVSFVESGKIQDALKRFERREQFKNLDSLTKAINFHKERLHWESATADQINSTKWNTARNLVNHFVEISSSENTYFKESFDWMESIASADMTTEICGDEKKFNSFQYLKYMFQTASQYKKSQDNIKRWFTVVDTEKDILQVDMAFEQTDKNDIKVQMHYDVTLKTTYVRRLNDSIFSITHVVQGGSCLEHEIVGYTSLENEDVIGYAEYHPDAKRLLNLFTPKVFQYSEDTKFSDLDVTHLPTAWLLGLPEDTLISICADRTYTVEPFQSWYHRFSQMWHPKAGDDQAITMQGLELKDGSLIARVTMKLQIGTNGSAPVHDWNLKIQAHMKEDKSWTVTEVEVLCPATISNLMNENYLAIRDVVGATFNLYVNDRKQWYTATDFGKHFRKYDETIELWSCDEKVEDSDDLPKYFWLNDKLWNATMIGYMIKEEMDPTPAAEGSFVMRVMMRPPADAPHKGDVFGSDWKFYIKWDNMDQFYYFTKAEFTCPKFMKKDGQWSHYRGLGSIRRKIEQMGKTSHIGYGIEK